jgi:hypothetical protein
MSQLPAEEARLLLAKFGCTKKAPEARKKYTRKAPKPNRFLPNSTVKKQP